MTKSKKTKEIAKETIKETNLKTEPIIEPIVEPEPIIEPIVEPEPIIEPIVEPEPSIEPIVEKKKETRGRKKKNVSSAKDKFAEYKPIEETSQAQAEPIYNNLISGYMLLMIIDVLMPYLSYLICKLLLKKEVDWKKIKIGSADLKEFEPIADEVAKKISMKVTPEIALTIMMGGLYFTKTALVLTEIENKKK